MLLKRYTLYFKNAGLYLTASLVTACMSVIINPFVAMNMSPADYGIVGFYTAFTTLFNPIIGFFIIDYYLRRFYQYGETERDILKGTIIRLYLYFSGIISLICLIGLYLYVQINDIQLPFIPYAVLTVVQLYFSQLYNFKLAEYRISANGKSFFWLSVVYGLTNVAFTLLFIVVLKFGAFGRLFSSMLLSLVFFCYCLRQNRHYLNLKFDKREAIALFKYSSPLVLAGLLGFWGNGYDKVLLEQYADLATLGIYTVGFQIAAYLEIFATSIKATFQPDVYKAIAEHNLRKVVKVMLLVIFIVGFIVFAFVIVCPFIIDILTAGRYLNSIVYVRILSLSIVTSTIYYQISQLTYGSGLSNITLLNKIIGSVLIMFLLWYLVSRFGAIGAAWGVVLSYVVFALGNIVLLIFFKNKLKNGNS